MVRVQARFVMRVHLVAKMVHQLKSCHDTYVCDTCMRQLLIQEIQHCQDFPKRQRITHQKNLQCAPVQTEDMELAYNIDVDKVTGTECVIGSHGLSNPCARSDSFEKVEAYAKVSE